MVMMLCNDTKTGSCTIWAEGLSTRYLLSREREVEREGVKF